jgi:DNA-binding HxlR family transcriptional regulator
VKQLTYAGRVRKASFANMNCSIAQSLEILGEWWTLLILRDCFLGIRRFDDFVERLGISRNVLTNRLDTLVDAGVLERRPYDEARGRYDYVLTDKGRALWPVMVALRQWGDEWIAGAGNEPLLLEHRGRGHTTTAQMTCDVCGETLDARSIRPVPGPGADARSSGRSTPASRRPIIPDAPRG